MNFFKNAFNFKGVTSRKTYWITTAFLSVFQVVLIGGIVLFNLYLNSHYMELNSIGKTVLYSIIILVELFLSIASLSMSIRRLHASGKKGYLWFINLIPGIGSIAFLVLMVLPDNLNSEYLNKTLNQEIQRIDDYNLRKELRFENELGHKVAFRDQIVNYTTETDLASFVFLLEGETTSSYVEKRLKKALYVFLELFIVIGLICILNFVFDLNLEINMALFLGLALVISYLIYKMDYMMLKSVFSKKQKQIKDNFPLWMSTLEVLVVTNNIPNTLKKSLASCPKPLKADLQKLVLKLEKNPVDKEAYASFLAEYNIPEIQEIVLDLYQFNFIDKNNISSEFSALHDRINRIASDTRKKRQESETFFIGALNSIPLMIVSFYILLISNLLSNAIMG